MKQHITPKQLNELSEKGRRRYLSFVNKIHNTDFKMEWWDSKQLSLLSIGQMIEFLGETWWKDFYAGDSEVGFGIGNNSLCNGLWEAVKEVLEK